MVVVHEIVYWLISWWLRDNEQVLPHHKPYYFVLRVKQKLYLIMTTISWHVILVIMRSCIKVCYTVLENFVLTGRIHSATKGGEVSLFYLLMCCWWFGLKCIDCIVFLIYNVVVRTKLVTSEDLSVFHHSLYISCIFSHVQSFRRLKSWLSQLHLFSLHYHRITVLVWGFFSHERKHLWGRYFIWFDQTTESV